MKTLVVGISALLAVGCAHAHAARTTVRSADTTSVASSSSDDGCPAAVAIPSRELVAAFRACGDEETATAYEHQLEVYAAAALPATETETSSVPVAVAAAEPGAPPPPAAIVPAAVALDEAFDAPFDGESDGASMLGPFGAGARYLVGYLGRRPLPWSDRQGLSLWNGFYCTDRRGQRHFDFAVAVRVDEHDVRTVANGTPICGPALDETGAPLPGLTCLLPPNRARTGGEYAYIMVGPGTHTVYAEVYDATMGVIPRRLSGASFTFNAAVDGTIHTLQWHEVGQPDGGPCGGS